MTLKDLTIHVGRCVLVGNVNIWLSRIETIITWQQQLNDLQIPKVDNEPPCVCVHVNRSVYVCFSIVAHPKTSRFSSTFLYVKLVDHFLEVSARKTNEMVKNFSENNILVLPSKFNSEEVERVSTYKYLRIDFDDQWKVSELATVAF